MFFAFHLVYDASGCAFHLHVVETDAAGLVLSHHPLRGEEARVSWMGGVCVMLPDDVEPMRGESIGEALRRGQCVVQRRKRAWIACGLSAGSGLDVAVKSWKLVGEIRNRPRQLRRPR